MLTPKQNMWEETKENQQGKHLIKKKTVFKYLTSLKYDNQAK